MALRVLRLAREREPSPKVGEMMPITGFAFPSGMRSTARLSPEETPSAELTQYRSIYQRQIKST